MKFILAKKVNMTQIFGEDGAVQAATVLNVEPATVSQIKTKEKDGYNAVQIGSGSRRGKNISKAVKGHIKNLEGFSDGKTGFAAIREFRIDDASTLNRGDKIEIETFAVGDK